MISKSSEMDYAGSKVMLFEVFINQEKKWIEEEKEETFVISNIVRPETLADEFIWNDDALLTLWVKSRFKT